MIDWRSTLGAKAPRDEGAGLMSPLKRRPQQTDEDEEEWGRHFSGDMKGFGTFFQGLQPLKVRND